MEQTFDFPRRLSARAITAGVLSAFGMMILLMSLAAAFGLWQFDMVALPQLGTAFWTWASAAWIISLAAGGYISALASRSVAVRDGLIHGFVTWASGCVVGCFFLIVTMGAIYVGQNTVPAFWGAFIGNALSLGAAVAAGAAGARVEAKYESIEKRERAVEESRLRTAG